MIEHYLYNLFFFFFFLSLSLFPFFLRLEKSLFNYVSRSIPENLQRNLFMHVFFWARLYSYNNVLLPFLSFLLHYEVDRWWHITVPNVANFCRAKKPPQVIFPRDKLIFGWEEEENLRANKTKEVSSFYYSFFLCSRKSIFNIKVLFFKQENYLIKILINGTLIGKLKTAGYVILTSIVGVKWVYLSRLKKIVNQANGIRLLTNRFISRQSFFFPSFYTIIMNHFFLCSR